jgi:hypothetical protein
VDAQPFYQFRTQSAQNRQKNFAQHGNPDITKPYRAFSVPYDETRAGIKLSFHYSTYFIKILPTIRTILVFTSFFRFDIIGNACKGAKLCTLSSAPKLHHFGVSFAYFHVSEKIAKDY